MKLINNTPFNQNYEVGEQLGRFGFLLTFSLWSHSTPIFYHLIIADFLALNPCHLSHAGSQKTAGRKNGIQSQPYEYLFVKNSMCVAFVLSMTKSHIQNHLIT